MTENNVRVEQISGVVRANVDEMVEAYKESGAKTVTVEKDEDTYTFTITASFADN